MPRPPRAAAAAGPGIAALTRTFRLWHGYLGALIAPTMLFLAFSGSLQLFHLHERHAGYSPPPWAAALGNLHKDQALRGEGHGHEDDHDGARPPRRPAGGDHEHAADARAQVVKWEFLAVAIALIASTLLGLWMALADVRRRRITLLLFAIGAAIPLATLFL